MKKSLLVAALVAFAFGCSSTQDLRVDAHVQPIHTARAPDEAPTHFAVDLAVDYGAVVNIPRQVAMRNQPKTIFVGQTDGAGRSEDGIGVDMLINTTQARFEISRYESGDVVEQRILLVPMDEGR